MPMERIPVLPVPPVDVFLAILLKKGKVPVIWLPMDAYVWYLPEMQVPVRTG
jgi:hypothetical protein